MRTEKVANCVNVAIMVSGEGDITEKIIQYFEPFLDVNISCIIINKDDSTIINKLRRYKINIYNSVYYKQIDSYLTKHNIHYIVLDNWFDKIPPMFCKKYQAKLINIYPTILPKYNIKGLYGDKLFKTIEKNKDTETGISIYYVNEEYGKGEIIFQKKVAIIEENWEHIKSITNLLSIKYYPVIIEKIIKETFNTIYEQNRII